MNRTWKVGTTSVGAAASLLAGVLAFGGDSDPGEARASSAERASVVRRDLAGAHRADPDLRVDEIVRRGGGAAVGEAREMVTSLPEDTRSGSWTTATGVVADDGASLTLTIPRRVTIVLPQYEGGRPPGATPPTYTPGTAPSVDRSDRRLIVDLGESGTFTPPAADPGEPGTFTPPEVILE